MARMSLSKREWLRLMLASVIAPSVPILALSIMSYGRVVPFLLLLGYLSFFLIGLPIVGILLKKKAFLSCVIGGGCAAITPIFLLNALSFFAANHFFTLENLFGYGSLFIEGCVGGALFWLIAFAERKR
jgi:hypothetical protein